MKGHAKAKFPLHRLARFASGLFVPSSCGANVLENPGLSIDRGSQKIYKSPAVAGRDRNHDGRKSILHDLEFRPAPWFCWES